jgi:hypothetical protein
LPNAPASDGFSVDNAKLTISRDKVGKIAASVGGTLTISAGLPQAVHLPVTFALAADGSFARGQHPRARTRRNRSRRARRAWWPTRLPRRRC